MLAVTVIPLRRYDRQRCEVKHVKDMQLLGAMAPPGGGRNAFSQRILACFATVNVTPPNDAQLRRIFGTILHAKLADFDDEVRFGVLDNQPASSSLSAPTPDCVQPCQNGMWLAECGSASNARTQVKPLGDLITTATIAIYRAVSRELLPTPSKSHYLFNTRDLAKIIQGMMQVRPWRLAFLCSKLVLFCECTHAHSHAYIHAMPQVHPSRLNPSRLPLPLQ